MKKFKSLREAAASDHVTKKNNDNNMSTNDIEFVDLHAVEVTDHPVATDAQHPKKGKKKFSGVRKVKANEEVDIEEEIELKEVEFIDEAEQVVTLPKGVGFYDTTKYPIGGKFDRVTDSNGLKVTVKRRFKLYKGTDTEGMTSDGKKVAFQMRLAKEEVEFIEEAVKVGTLKLENGKSIKVTKEDAVALNTVLKSLNPDNRKRMEVEMMKDQKSYNDMLTFAKRTD